MIDVSAVHTETSEVLTPAAVLRCIGSLTAAILDNRGTATEQTLERDGWRAETRLYASDEGASLNADSLTVMNLAVAVNTLFQVSDSGLEEHLLRARTLGDWVDVVMRSRRSGARALAFTSSGSTGEPTVHRHEWADLLGEVRDLAPRLDTRFDDGLKRVVVCVPRHHIYGFLFGVLLPAVSDVTVLEGPSAMLSVHDGRLARGDLVVGFPWLWQSVVTAGTALSPSVVGMSSTGPLPIDIGGRLRARGLRDMIEIHGSSETAGIGWRDRSDQPYTLMDRWQRGTKPGGLIRRRDRSEAQSMPDRVDWVDDAHYWPRGRCDHAVQVAGYNVYPTAVAATIAAHPDVDQAYVRLMRPGEGERLKAYVVASDRTADPQVLRRQIEAWCREHRMTTAQTPGQITIGPTLPRNAIGKLSDW